MSRFKHVVSLFALVAACQSESLAPAPYRASFGAMAAPVTCPATPTVTVSNDASLRAALATATPGAVIAVSGMIGVTQDDSILTERVRLTCATPGSGLFAIPGPGVVDMVTVGARNVTVDHLVLDGSQALEGPYGSVNDGLTVFAESSRFTNNTVTCAPFGVCMIIAGGRGALITDNSFTSTGSFSGVHLQVLNGIPIDGARIERNRIVATAPSTGPRQGGIRVFVAANLVIADNTVVGPWQNSLSPVGLANSQVQGNHFQGALRNGIRLSAAIPSNLDGTRVSGNMFAHNQVTGAGLGGVFAYLACRNVFVGNDLQGNTGNIALIFPDSSGANAFVGNGTIVVDNGVMDCDGDGVSDPNIITGAGAVLHGVTLGQVVSDAVTQPGRGIPLQ